ncbi:NACHT domain-containing protein [Streptomyces sp. NPDC057654]|uniref:NACHT domain-containing protein n=1 Tax=Streptomyces sp. NPDC057654 TaxID=3346196 RepID=UPI003687B902
MPEELVELKARLRQLRVARGLSLSGLERRAGLGHTTTSRALNGSTVPSQATVVALAHALDTDATPLLALRRKALPSVPALVRTPVGTATEDSLDAQFEERYRQYVEDRYAHISVIGLAPVEPGRPAWPLDTSYLSLEPATHPGARPRTRGDASLSAGASDLAGTRADGAAQRAEQVLAGRWRTVVRGPAGGGKTTLLQWLAVMVARRELPEELAHWAACMPFLLPLRTLVRRGDLPGPQEYLAALGCPLHGTLPAGWADRVLADGRALLLIDGVDEVPREQRARTGQWLLELLAAYPQAAVIVTTRPSAVPDEWLAEHDFTVLALHPMRARDVSAFITRWHAAAADAGTAERAYLVSMGEALVEAVRARHDLAQLATTPMLCASVCALNRDRRGHLPRDRMGLYEALMSMLLICRDRAHDSDAPEHLALTQHESVPLLQRLAYWLIRHGQTEMDDATAISLIGDALPSSAPRLAQREPADVLAHLVARSGLLHAPAADTIAFVHRTFQDYLGAQEALEARDIPLLIRNAHDGRWEDIVRRAVAHARPQERATLLRRLIARGDRTAPHRTRLYVLAAACLEHATELDPDTQREVERRAAALVPPTQRG